MIKIKDILEEVAIYLAMVVIGALAARVIAEIFKVRDVGTFNIMLIISISVMLSLPVIDRFSKKKSG